MLQQQRGRSLLIDQSAFALFCLSLPFSFVPNVHNLVKISIPVASKFVVTQIAGCYCLKVPTE
jgi:predicted membrane chloride channel (bestrophin family)